MSVNKPLFPTVKIGLPALLAVRRSPTPELSVTNAANEVFPETDAATVVPANGAPPPVTLNCAVGVD